VLAALLPAAAALAAGNTPGSYCPFPEKGEKPKCMVGAEERYADFYRDLAKGNVDPAQAAKVESDLAAGTEAASTYQALSSLAYGYYVLARSVAASPEADPELVARLERWNQLLAAAYRDTPAHAELRGAMRAAAEDIRLRAPPVELACTDAEGRPARCTSTEAVLRSMDEARDQTGIRGQLGRLMQRLLQDDGS
jgi:hypothetical protein